MATPSREQDEILRSHPFMWPKDGRPADLRHFELHSMVMFTITEAPFR